MSYTVTSSPATEPVSATDFRDFHLNITDETKETGLDELVTMVRTWIERKYDKAIITQQITEIFDCWPDEYLSLSVSPVASVGSVTYTDQNGDPQAFTNYDLKKGRLYARISLKDGYSWPQLKRKPEAITVVYTAGEATAPAHVKQFIRTAVGRMYYDKETITQVMSNIELLFPEIAIMV